MDQTAEDSYRLAQAHLERVQDSWDEPTDWANLSSYGLYCIEACIVAVALHLGYARPSNHREKIEMGIRLEEEQGLPAVDQLLVDLNDMRKHEAYGDVYPPEGLSAEAIAGAIEEYVDAVGTVLAP